MRALGTAYAIAVNLVHGKKSTDGGSAPPAPATNKRVTVGGDTRTTVDGDTRVPVE